MMKNNYFDVLPEFKNIIYIYIYKNSTEMTKMRLNMKHNLTLIVTKLIVVHIPEQEITFN